MSIGSRRAGVIAGAIVLISAIVLLFAGRFSSASNAAPTSHAIVTAAQRQAINSKVSALLAKMTVHEKFGQLEMSGPTPDNNATLEKEAKAGQVGSVLDLIGVSDIDKVQKAALQSRLHIPLIFGLDVIHGYRTMFPVPLGEASSWDPPVIKNDEVVSADEATADGIKWTFNPMVDISRDPRWGRVVEGAGEDPFLGLGGRRRQGPRLPGQRLQRAAPDGGDGQALRRLRRSRRGARIQHGRHVRPAAAQRLPAAVQGGRRRRRGDRDDRVQLAQRRAGERQPVPAADDPAPGVGLRRHRRVRLPGDPGADRLRLRVRTARRPRAWR